MEPEPALIVIVDDDADTLEWARLILEHEGYRTACFASPHEALDFMARKKPQLVITDLMMDTLSAGFTFAERIREDSEMAHVPIIVLTAAASQRGFDFVPKDAQDLEAMRVDALFPKPVNPETLLVKVRSLLAGA